MTKLPPPHGGVLMTAVSAMPCGFGHKTQSLEPSVPVEVGRLLPPVFVEQLPVATSEPAASHPDGRHPELLESPIRLAFRQAIYERSLAQFRRDPPAAALPPRGQALTKAAPSRRRGPKTKKMENVKEEMHRKLASGQITKQMLGQTKEEALAAEYDVSRHTVRRARNEVLSEFVEN
jgi:hypothetical protein